MTQSLIDNSDKIFTERRQRKRCLKCQQLFALLTIFIGSFALLLVFNLFPRLINKGNFQVISASSYELNNGNDIAIDADLKINFPDDVVDALENGIPLTIAVEVEVLRKRFWWRDLVIKRSTKRFELRYHPLTNVHEVKNIATGDRYSFDSRQDAMAVLGTIRGALLIEKKELSTNEQHFVQMRILLDISRLPPELRQVASFSSSWRLESTWYQWQINEQSKVRQQVTDKTDLVPVLNKQGVAVKPVVNDTPDNTSINRSSNTGMLSNEVKEKIE